MLKLLPILLTYLMTTFPLYGIMNSQEPTLILNMENIEVSPKNFRMFSPFSPFELTNICTKGLEKFQASASGQFSLSSLNFIKSNLPQKKIIIVDLREESHGFLDGTAISWYTDRDWMNLGKSLSEIIADENSRLSQIKNKGFYNLAVNEMSLLRKIHVSTNEESIVRSFGWDYIRLPITDHCRPTDAVVEQILQIFKKQSPDDWFHFHCSAGKGRSSTLMVMYDIFYNCKDVALVEILKRQASIGGIDFTSEPNQEVWKYPYLKERIEFLEHFYDFCLKNEDNFVQSWTEWATQRQLSLLAR